MKLLSLIILTLLISFKSFSLDIDQTIKNTVSNNIKIKIGLEKLVSSKELIEKATGSKLPTITGTLSGIYSKSEVTSDTVTTTPETLTDKYKLSITQNIYDAGFNDLEIERSKILFNNEILNFRIIIQDLILNAIEGYLTVLNYEQSLEATKKNYDLVSKALEETNTKYSLGSSTLYDLQTAESAFAIAKSNLYASEQNLLISKKTFERIVGLKPINLEDIINIETNLDFDVSLKKSLENNLNLKLLLNDIENNNILLLKEKKSKQPNLDLTGSAEYSDAGRIDSGSETTNCSISLTLTVPLYQQGIDNSNIRKYRSEILQSEMNYEDYKDDLQIQISNVFKDITISKIKMNSNLSVIQASNTALKSLKKEYDIGTKTIMDIVEEESKLLDTNSEYLNFKKDYLINYFVMKSLEGTLLDDFENYLPNFN